MKGWQPRQPPPLRRGIPYALAIALAPSIAALREGDDDAIVTFLSFGALNVAFFVAWTYWDESPRKLSSELVWLALVMFLSLVVFVTVASLSALAIAAMVVAPVAFLILIWLALRYLLRLRTRP